MGEVYRARDTRLDRTVAIKVLPSMFADDPVLRQRLEREARAISALDHPHICSLYDIGIENGTNYLVMQFVTGETLADRLVRGAMPAGEVASVAAQIAEALAAAHAHGIVHRDLKPGNVMLTRDGVKLLDFGLAKQSALATVSEVTQSRGLPLTAERTIVGTLHYMAPEQLEGREIDPRADIFALGAVMYEMLSRSRAFAGDSSATIIAAIMTGARTPLVTRVPAAPPALIRIIDRCLATDSRDRWQSASDLAYALRQVDSASGPLAQPATMRRVSWPWIVAGAALATTLVAVGLLLTSRRDAPDAAELRLSIVPPDGLGLAFDAADYDPDFAISPDGRRVAFVVTDAAGERRLFVRDLSAVIPREIGGTAGARRPFWAFDGQSIGYMTVNGLNRVPLDRGSPQPISSTVAPSATSIAIWTPDDRIIYEAPLSREGPDSKGLFEVPITGGTAKSMFKGRSAPNEQGMRYPVALPDGRHYLYLSWTPDPADRAIYLAAFDSDRRSLLVRTGFRAGFVAPDTLVYIRDRVLVAQRFSIENAALLGEPRQLAFGVAMEGIPGQATFDVSRSGVLAYRSRSRQFASELRWMTRTGQSELAFGARSDIAVSLAPDDRRVAVARLDLSSPDDERFSSSIWLLDLIRRVPSRFTVDPSSTDENPTWSPDGTEVAYGVHQGNGLAEVRAKITNSTADSRVIVSGQHNFHPIDWAGDGTLLLHAYATGAGADDLDLYLLGPQPAAKPQPFVVARGSQAQGQFSPDGTWIAYVSDESGKFEVYVRPRDGRNVRTQISSDGGAQPRWRRDGKEIFYVSLTGTLMAVPVTVGTDEVSPGVPLALFTEPSLRTNNNVYYYGGAAAYDVSRDGLRFLVNRLTREPSAGPIHLVINWEKDR